MIQPDATRAGVRRIAVTIALSSVAGCATGPFSHPENDIIGPSLQRLHEIETVDLQSQSGAEPLTVEQAASQEIENLLDRTKTKPSVDLSLPARPHLLEVARINGELRSHPYEFVPPAR